MMMEGQDEEMNVEMNILPGGSNNNHSDIPDDSDGKNKHSKTSFQASSFSFWQLKGYSVKILALMIVWVVAFATYDRTRNRSTMEESAATVQIKTDRLDTHQALMKEAKKVLEQVANDAPNNNNNNNIQYNTGVKTPPPLTGMYYEPPDNVIRGTVPPHVQNRPWIVESHDDRQSVNNKGPSDSYGYRKEAIESAFRHPQHLSKTMVHPDRNHEPTKKITKLSSKISAEKPIFVLSLPNSGQMAMNRYFKCAGLKTPGFLGRYWTKIDDLQIGHCMNLNRHSGRHTQPILKTCGDYKVWTEMDYDTLEPHHKIPTCLFPSLRPDILDELFTTYPEATVINVMKDPQEWYKTLSPMMKKRWYTSCNHNHNDLFPTADAPKEEWIQFYNNHHKQLREVVANYTSIDFIEIDLSAKPVANAIMLNKRLETPGECWWKHAMNETLSTDITYPIFVTSLPKSAIKTTHDYLNCGFGKFEGRNAWTKFEDSGEQVPIGECFRQNIWENKPLDQNCGQPKFWTDIGTVSPDEERCYFPTFMKRGLEAIYHAHPYATILHTTRDAHNWFESTQHWRGMLNRWTRHCHGFPNATATDVDAWTEFYDWHTKHVRHFVKHHPTINYIEIKAEDEKETLETLQNNFGFKNSCWGHANKNPNYDHRLRH